MAICIVSDDEETSVIGHPLLLVRVNPLLLDAPVVRGFLGAPRVTLTNLLRRVREGDIMAIVHYLVLC